MNKSMYLVVVIGVLLMGPIVAATATEIFIHSASYSVRTDNGLSSFQDADSIVLVYLIEEKQDANAIVDYLYDSEWYDVQWRSRFENEFSLPLVGFTGKRDNNREPEWNEKIQVGNAPQLLLLFVDEDMAFDDPFGFCMVDVSGKGQHETWIKGLRSYKQTRVGKVRYSLD